MWWSERSLRTAALGLTVALAACGFEPLYDPAGPAAAIAGRVEVAVVPGTPGYLMRERLVERLGPAAAPTHLLAIVLGFDQVGVAITEDDVTSRFDVVGVADWRLTEIGAETPALAEAARAVTGYSAPSSATTSSFAILSAREDAERRLAVLLADRIAQRIAVAADDWASGGGDPAP